MISLSWIVIEVAWAISKFVHGAGTLSRYGIRSLEKANSVLNINRAKSLQKKTESNLLADEKVSSTLGPGSCLDLYLYLIINRFS